MADEAVVPYYEKRITDKMKRGMDQMEAFRSKIKDAHSSGQLIFALDSYVEGAMEAAHTVRECGVVLDSLTDASLKGEDRTKRALWVRGELAMEVFRKAEHPTRSSSPMSNLSAQLHLAVLADIHDDLSLIGKA